MTKKRFLWWSIPMLVLVVAATALAYPDLPATVPTHWNAAGQVDGQGPRSTIFLQPVIMGLLLLMWPWLPKVSPDRFRVEGFGDTWWFSGMVVVGLLAYVQGVVLAVIVHGSLDIGRALLGGIAIALVLLGNVLGKVKRNFWLGVRTPWTLASDRVWYATHRLAGKTMLAGGLLALGATLAGLPPYVATAALLAGALVPAIYSLVYYKRLERSRGA
ncbi:SdpI family protein [Massilia sp. LXY-6]|uniref:SdpI family protein n=1 Tax=Massilia sp. LXY-6 TaxID=3379823 RepID=UPI003EE13E5D